GGGVLPRPAGTGRRACGADQLCLHFKMDRVAPIDIAGPTPPVQGDEIRVSPVGGGSIGSLDGLGIYGGGIATFSIVVAQSVEGPLGPADWNGDGMGNSQDFFDFLALFFANTADFNADGQTNSQDFFDYLGAFFQGC